MKEWFASWFDSPYYHLLYKHRNDDEAQIFIANLVQHLQLHSHSTVLDVACGKGRHALAFAQYGADVTGIDLSPESIQHAQQYEHSHLQFFVHDMRRLFRSNYFDVVCNLFTSFGYFHHERDHILAARSMAQALRPGGSLLIDFVNQAHALHNIQQKPHEQIISDNIQFDIKRTFTDTHYLKDIHITDGSQQFHFTEKVRRFTPDSLLSYFSQSPLTLRHIFGDYQLSSYHPEHSPRIILLLQKN